MASRGDIAALTSDDFNDNIFYSTQLRYRTYCLNWTIEDHSFVSKTMKTICSQKFPSENKEKKQWYIELQPTEINNTNEKKYGIKLCKTFPEKVHVEALIVFEIAGGRRSKFTCNNIYYENISWSISGKELYHDLDLGKNEIRDLNVTCKFRVFNSAVDICKPKSIDQLPKISSFFDDENFKDVTIFVEGQKFKAHKLILAARSSVFAAMFTQEMSEQVSSNFFLINDMKADTFEKLLRFIYTDKVEQIDHLVADLLAAANKYDLEKLKEICIVEMCKSLSVENVVETLRAAELYSIVDLKNRALRFLGSHRKNVIDSEKFKQFIKTHPHLALELLEIGMNNASPDVGKTVLHSKYIFRDTML